MLTKHRGEFLLFMGAITFSVNGIFATVVLEHMSAFRLAQIRAIAAFALLFLFAVIKRRDLLRVTREQVPLLLLYGIVGFALVNLGYFLGIERKLPLGLVLILEFTAPIWVVLWIKYVRKGFVAKDMWVAIALALVGLVLVVRVWDGFSFDLLGTVGALGSAFALTAYFLIGERVLTTRPPMSATILGIGIAGAFWAIVLPIWKFPTAVFTTPMDLHGPLAGHTFPGWLAIGWVVVMGTIVPYSLVISGLSMLSASKSSVMGMLEPVFASVFAWIWLGQGWALIQICGAVFVLVGVYLADRSKSTAS